MKDYVCDQCHKRGGLHAPQCQRLLSQLKAVAARLKQDEREPYKPGIKLRPSDYARMQREYEARKAGASK